MRRISIAIGFCLAAVPLAASEDGSGVYGATCKVDEKVFRINIRADGNGEVQYGETTFLELLTSYSYFGDATPQDFLIAVLFNLDGSPITPGPDDDPRIEIWTDDAGYYALLNGDANRRLDYCGPLGTPGATANMPYSTEYFSAVGYLSCTLADAEMPMYCPFGVNRGDPGSASIELKTPTRADLILNFDGDTVSDPSQQPVEFDRSNGMWTIRVGEDVYEIPDEVISGG